MLCNNTSGAFLVASQNMAAWQTAHVNGRRLFGTVGDKTAYYRMLGHICIHPRWASHPRLTISGDNHDCWSLRGSPLDALCKVDRGNHGLLRCTHPLCDPLRPYEQKWALILEKVFHSQLLSKGSFVPCHLNSNVSNGLHVTNDAFTRHQQN